MPQVQFLDMPSWGSALGQFGGGILDEYAQSHKRQSEEDALEKLIGQMTPEMNEEEKLKLIYGSKGVPFEQKKQVAQSVSEIIKNAKTVNANQLKETKDNEMKGTLIGNGVPEWLADLYIGSTEGGKTAIMKHLLEENPELFQKIDSASRGSISGEEPDEMSNIGKTNEQVSQEDQINVPDYDKGLSRKERVKRQDERYKLQIPKASDNMKELRALDADQRDIEELMYLNDKMAEQDISWLRQANIMQFGENAGDIIFPKAATPEQAQWQKIVYGFQKRAKESYGARVTNFDIANFMKRFPGLAHSPEARRMILKQMQLVNEIDRTYKKELDNVVEKVGIRNIDWDKAERLAQRRTDPKIEKIKKEFKSIEKGLTGQEDTAVKAAKADLLPGKVLVRDPEGNYLQASPKKAKQLQNETGWKVYK